MGYLPSRVIARLRQKYSQPLVPLELLESPEGVEDVLHIISGGDILQGALLRGRLQEFRRQLQVKRQIAQSQANAIFKRPRLPTRVSDAASMQETYAVSANALTPFTRRHGKSGLGKALLAVEEDPDILESRERERWVEVLSTYIVEAGLPVVTLIEGSADRDRPGDECSGQDSTESGTRFQAVSYLARDSKGTHLAGTCFGCDRFSGGTSKGRLWLQCSGGSTCGLLGA